MRLVLDTHALIWSVDADQSHRLGKSARAALADRSNEILISAASGWEIATKHRRGRLPEGERIVQRWAAIVAELGGHDLSVTSAHALLAGGLPGAHGDPFDRLLTAQAIIEDAYLVTIDRRIAGLGAKLLW